MPSKARASRISLKDLVNAGHLHIGDVIYNIAHNSITKKQDRLYARICDDYRLEVIAEQFVPEGTKYASLNEFMRNHLNVKILRGETDRTTTSASVWEWTFKNDGTRFRVLRKAMLEGQPQPQRRPHAALDHGGSGSSPIEVVLQAIDAIEQAYPEKRDILVAQRKWFAGLIAADT